MLLAAALVLAPAPGRSPAAEAEAFYRFHFARPDMMYLCRACLERERRFFTPKLARLLVYELDRYDKAAAANGGPANFKPFVAGDVFTGTEETPDTYRLGRAEVSGATAKVPVTVRWTGANAGNPDRTVTVVMTRAGGRWLVDNVIYPDGNDLVDLLGRPEYDSYGT